MYLYNTDQEPPHPNDLARYLVAFRMQHPVAYYLWYRHRILWATPRSLRRKTLDTITFYARSRHGSLVPPCMDAFDEFAFWHPVLFLPVDAFQLLKKMLTAPRKVFRTREEK
jgi:hypothetical protein